jgi:hypothetical protein
LAWTDPAPELGRSRDALLADVVRRGARMRRRRRTGTAMAAAMALAIPVTLLVAAVGTGPDRRVNLTVAGPSVTDAGAPVTTSAVPVLPPDLAADAPTTTVRRRGSTPLAPPTTLVLPGVAAAGPSSTAPVELRPDPADATPTTGAAAAPVDPSGRPAPPPGGFGSSTAAGSGQATGVAASTTVPPGTAGTGADAPLADCAAADVAVTVATENPAYAPGDTVRGFSMLENRSATACLLPTRSFFHVQDASGATVSNFSYTADYRLPVRAEPGRTVTDGFAWDQRNCAAGPCAQVAAGTYTVVAEWTEGGTYRGRSSFRVG